MALRRRRVSMFNSYARTALQWKCQELAAKGPRVARRIDAALKRPALRHLGCPDDACVLQIRGTRQGSTPDLSARSASQIADSQRNNRTK